MAEQLALSFAGLVRQLRAEAGLTQEELAEAADLPVRTLSDLERGVTRTAHKDTAGLLASALGLAGPARAVFVAAARGKTPAADVLAAPGGAVPGPFAAVATRALPRDIAAFTGRQAELTRLVGTLTAAVTRGGVAGIHAIDGMAGVGKTTFAVHAAHRLTSTFPDGQFFLPLHAHTPGQRPVGPADALASLLQASGVAAPQIPTDLEARAARWRDYVAGKRILLLLDDAASHEQIRPLLPGTAGSLVLVTSRRRLTALEDTAVISLDILPATEAAVLLARLAARPALRPGDAAVGEITRLCGYLPLAIGMLASQLRHHPTWTAEQVAAELAAARDRLALMHAENLSVAAAFGLSYADLTPGRQRLFRRLGLVPCPSVDAYAAAALDHTSVEVARRHLEELYHQHLLTEPTPGRYQLHDLLREHARTLAAADDPAQSGAATERLLDYYLHTTLAASQHIPSRATAPLRLPNIHRLPGDAPGLATLAQASAWLEAERPNLHAAADHAAASGHPQYAVHIAAAAAYFLRSRGHWDQATALHQTALAAARQAGDRPGQASALSELGLLAWLTGDYPAAATTLAQAVDLYAETGDGLGQAYALNRLGFVHELTGNYPAATASHQQALALARASDDQLAEASALIHLGFNQQLTGDYPASQANLADALALSRSLGHRPGQADALNNLGTLHTLTGDYPAAAANIGQALEIFRDLGHRLGEAAALNDLGVVQRETGDCTAAEQSLRQALEIFRDLGSQLGQAEALNRLGDLTTQTSATHQARQCHTQALAIARTLGVPIEQAHALEGLGRSHLCDGNTSEGTAHLRQALTIYQHLNNPIARRVKETLRQYGTQPAPPRPARTRPN